MRPIKESFTFDDFLLMPKKSSVFSRKDVSVSAQFSRNITLHIPIVSANMDTVTGARMARFMAKMGGLSIVHRFLSIEKQADEVRKVKRAENVVIDDPYTISSSAMVADAQAVMIEHGVSGLPVLDEKKRVVGIITRRDILFTENKKQPVTRIMTKKIISAPRNISLSRAKTMLFEHRIEKLPLLDSRGNLRGLITLKDILRKAREPFASKDARGQLLVGAAVGVKDETLTRAKALLDAGVDVLVVDVAHGHNRRSLDTLCLLKKRFHGIDVVAGNIATVEAARDLIKAGADGIKIGIGPGAACITRVVTGVGVPQLSAIIETSGIAKKHGVPVIADGGIRNSGDFAKALAAGGSTVMIGSLLAGTDESPGEYILEEGIGYKLYRGMASRDASEEKEKIDGGADGVYRVPEGKSGKVPYRGTAQKVIDDLVSGLRSSMSYLGAHNLSEFQKNAEFIRITQAGLRESHWHDMK